MALGTDQSQPGTQSSTLVVVNATVKRTRAIITNLSDFIGRAGTENQKRMGRVMGIIIDEAMEELAERDEHQTQKWLMFMSAILHWSSSGNIGVLPSELVPFVADVEGIPVEEALQRWEAATGMSRGMEVVDAEIVEE